MYMRSFSHEIRHPVTSILSLSHLIQQTDNIQPEILTPVRHIENEVKCLLNLQNQMKDLTEIESNSFELNECEFEVIEIIKESTKIIKDRAFRRGIQLINIINKNVPKFIFSDKQRIFQILTNLLLNAFKYTEEGFIKVQVSFKQKILKFTVEDSGIGMTQETIDHLFDSSKDARVKLFNVNQSLGIGLTLYLCQQLSLRLGGKPMKVQSSPGQGTKFCFYVYQQQLPQINSFYIDSVCLINPNENIEQQSIISIKEIEVTAQEFKEKEGILQNCECPKILLVDDTEMIRQFLQVFLITYNPDEAANGQQAVDKVILKKQNECCKQYKLIIMDCEMPILNGWEATSQIRKLGYQGIILGYTAYNSQQDFARCIQAGMDTVLIKPSPCKDILETVEKLLNQHQ